MSMQKIQAAQAALAFVEDYMILGIGTGSTVNFFINELAAVKHKIEACVASSVATEVLLRKQGIPVIDLNSVNELALYIDGADEVTSYGYMIKGGGGALTREKILASAARQFICIADASKQVKALGEFPIAVEVIPIARSLVARQLVQLGVDPEYRAGFVTDNGNIILDVFSGMFEDPEKLETQINAITGVVENGIFAHRLADKVLIGSTNGVICLK